MTGLVLSIAVLATGSILPNAYAAVKVPNWELTLENTKSGRTTVFTQGGLPDCASGGNTCTIVLSDGKLRKCTNLGTNFISFDNLEQDDMSGTVTCNGSWKLHLASDAVSCTSVCTFRISL